MGGGSRPKFCQNEQHEQYEQSKGVQGASDIAPETNNLSQPMTVSATSPGARCDSTPPRGRYSANEQSSHNQMATSALSGTEQSNQLTAAARGTAARAQALRSQRTI